MNKLLKKAEEVSKELQMKTSELLGIEPKIDVAAVHVGAVPTGSTATELNIAQPELPAKRQIELADFDIEILNAGQYSEKAWEAVGRRHKIDHTTREAVEGGNGRIFLAVPKNWVPLPTPQGQPVGTQNINNIIQGLGSVPVHAGSNIAAVRAQLLSRELTKPMNDETHEEEI